MWFSLSNVCGYNFGGKCFLMLARHWFNFMPVASLHDGIKYLFLCLKLTLKAKIQSDLSRCNLTM